MTTPPDQLAILVDRVLADRELLARCVSDLDGTLAAEGITLSPEELAAVREFQAEIAGASVDEVYARLSDPTRRQGPA
jgi:hypothetical protein